MVKQVRVTTETGEVTKRRVHPSPSAPPSIWYDEQRDAEPTINVDTQAFDTNDGLVDGKYVFGYTVRDLTAQELSDKSASVYENFISKRDYLLQSTDFTQLGDSPKDSARWRPYRQALRDLPANTVDLSLIHI